MSAAANLAGVYLVYIFTIAFLLLCHYKFTYLTEREFFLRREQQTLSHKHRWKRRSRLFSSFAAITVRQTLQPLTSILFVNYCTLRRCPSILHIEQEQKNLGTSKKAKQSFITIVRHFSRRHPTSEEYTLGGGGGGGGGVHQRALRSSIRLEKSIKRHFIEAFEGKVVFFRGTVKPVYNDHLRFPQKVVVIDRWSL